jgi:hypothetical protein
MWSSLGLANGVFRLRETYTFFVTFIEHSAYCLKNFPNEKFFYNMPFFKFVEAFLAVFFIHRQMEMNIY